MPGRTPDARLFSIVPTGPLRSPDKGGDGGRGKRSGDQPGKPKSSGETPKQPTPAQIRKAWDALQNVRKRYGTNANDYASSEAIRDLNRAKALFDKFGIPRPKGWLDSEPPEEPPLVGGGGGRPRRGGPGEGAGKTANIPRDPHNPQPDRGAAVPVPAGRREDDDK